MARNKLLGSAIPLADLVKEKYYARKQNEIAAVMECEPSTVCRMMANDEINKTLNLLTALGLSLYDVEKEKPVKKVHLEMFEPAIRKGMDHILDEYLGK